MVKEGGHTQDNRTDKRAGIFHTPQTDVVCL
jgi:hypothetical protein